MNATNQRSIAIIGLSGTGKSTVARLLGAQLGWFWVDIDDRIVQRASRSIAEIFGSEGETHFRKLESDVLSEILQLSATQPCVIATGGGIVMQEQNRRSLREQTYIVWLDAPTSILTERLRKHNEQRPLLGGQHTEQRLEVLRAARQQFYQELANQFINTAGIDSAQVAEQIFAGYMEKITANTKSQSHS